MFNIIRLQRSRSRSFATLTQVGNAPIGTAFGENGEKLHLLSNGIGTVNGSANGLASSAAKPRISENSSSSALTEENSSEHASLLKCGSNGVMALNPNGHVPVTETSA